MQKLSKDQIKERDEITARLRSRRDDLDKAIETFNELRGEAWAQIEQAREDYNEVVADANEWRDGIVTTISDYIGDRSEKWQESDKGQAVEAWKSEFESDIEQAEIEEPEALDLDMEDAADIIEQLPEECEA